MITKHALLSADGASDAVLIPILEWLIQENVKQHIQLLLDLTFVQHPGGATLTQRLEMIERSTAGRQPDAVFIHRDAESANYETRYDEIISTYERVFSNSAVSPVCVIPIRMTEAWLLFDEKAIRFASDNPNGRAPLSLPRLRELETLVDPKAMLKDLLLAATDLGARRRRSFQRTIHARIRNLTDYIHDYSPLRELSAFSRLENDIRTLLDNWDLLR